MSLSNEIVLPGRISPSEPAPSIKPHPEFYFDETMVVIQVENTLFKVHKYFLLKSETFSDMFKLPHGVPSSLSEGEIPERPIALEGVEISYFEALLQVLYSSYFSADQSEPSPSLIIPAFRLAKMWNFTDLCAHLAPLAGAMFGDADKIVFAREFQFDQWIIPSHTKLCQRSNPLNSEEASKIGLSSVLFISRIREEILKSPSRSMSNTVIQAKVDAWIKGGCVFST